MTKFTQTTGNVISAVIATYFGLFALGQIPDNHYTHGVGLVLSGVQLFMVNLGFHRTPSGTVIPPTVAKFVDRTAAQKDEGSGGDK